MSLATDILKRSGLAPLSPRKRRFNTHPTYLELHERRKTPAQRLAEYWNSIGYTTNITHEV